MYFCYLNSFKNSLGPTDMDAFLLLWISFGLATDTVARPFPLPLDDFELLL